MNDNSNSGWASFGKFVGVLCGIAGVCAALYGIYWWGGTSATSDLTRTHEEEVAKMKADYETKIAEKDPQILAMALVLQDILGDETLNKAIQDRAHQGWYTGIRENELYRTCLTWTTPAERNENGLLINPKQDHIAEARFKLEYNPEGKVISVGYPKVTEVQSCARNLQARNQTE